MKHFPQILTIAICAGLIFMMSCQRTELSPTNIMNESAAMKTSEVPDPPSAPPMVSEGISNLSGTKISKTNLSLGQAILASKLPSSIHNFIDAYFPFKTVQFAFTSIGKSGMVYTVTLSNGIELMFDSNGNLIDTEQVRMELDLEISMLMIENKLPVTTLQYLKTNYDPKQISDDIRQYINNTGSTTKYHVVVFYPDDKLKFDENGEFISNEW